MRKTKFISLLTAMAFAMCGSSAFAYTVSGTVKDTTGAAVKGTSVSLLTKGKSAITDQAGLFTIHEDEVGIISNWQNSLGYVSIKSGMFSVTQQGSNSIKIEIFDLGYSRNVLFSTASEFRYALNAKDSKTTVAKKAIAADISIAVDTLRVTADGFDTLNVPLANLDTTLSHVENS